MNNANTRKAWGAKLEVCENNKHIWLYNEKNFTNLKLMYECKYIWKSTLILLIHYGISLYCGN